MEETLQQTENKHNLPEKELKSFTKKYSSWGRQELADRINFKNSSHRRL